MNEKLLALGTNNAELFCELYFALRRDFDSLGALLAGGYGLYPDVLSYVVIDNQKRVLEYLFNYAARADSPGWYNGKYDAKAICDWLEAYYGGKWGSVVERCGLFFLAAPKQGQAELVWDAIGLQNLEDIYVKANPEKLWFDSLTEYLMKHKAYEILLAGKAYGCLADVDGLNYLAERKNYDAILSILEDVDLSEKEISYCREILDVAQLSHIQAVRYNKWKLDA